ncbi:acyl carrier protein [Streptomyces sp. N50]|jgi:acyl carrier protein|uniref:acyl carrier protein n=1 Tax=Streptomyces sp. N50 TaxID=3081765 RepID=UPI0029620D68|nr:phosphopantetheine-binding protein [Streptomyces sp. N50]WOX17072.1 phosphopantetheine-binding protein [Streptomyces sp. N50]
MSAVYDHLVTTLSGKFEVPAATVRPDISYDELGLDSLAVMELFLTLQEEWAVPLEDSEAVGTLTVQETVDLIEKLKAES